MRNVLIEAGNIYAPDIYRKPVNPSFRSSFSNEGIVVNRPVEIGLSLANRFRSKLSNENLSYNQVLLIDDVGPRHKQAQSEDPWRWELFIQRPAAQIVASETQTPITIFWENSFIAQGKEMVGQLQQATNNVHGYRLSEDRRLIITGTGKNKERIRLLGYSSEYPTLPSCEVLDLCIYQAKLQEAEEAITFLPEDYREQQGRVRKLFQVLGKEAPVTTVFFNNAGAVSAVDQWHTKPTPQSGLLANLVKTL